MTEIQEDIGMEPSIGRHSVGRRRFLGYLIGGTTVVAAAELGLLSGQVAAKIPSAPQVFDAYDLSDLLTHAAQPTSGLITVTINEDGTASFALPRAEVGQGITTAAAMIIAEELDLPLKKIDVTLAPARPELVWNQITGGSNTIHAMYTPIRVAAAVAKKALLEAAAAQLDGAVDELETRDGVITDALGNSLTYGELAAQAASPDTKAVEVGLKDEAKFTLLGKPTNRIDALDAVTGKKVYTTDLDVKDALPTMLCRAPTLNGKPKKVLNAAEVKAMPGVTHVAMVPTGVAVRARTFGQCIDGVRALRVDWEDGPVAGESDQDILSGVKAAELPMPSLPNTPIAKTIAYDFTFWFRSNSPMDTNSAIADVRSDRAEIWSGLKNPIVTQQQIALELGLTPDKVKVNVMQAGGSFGRRLFFDGAMEAAQVSKAMGVPVKLMWHRSDDARVGRAHPLATSRVRAMHAAGEVLAFQQSHTAVEMDLRHGFGEIVTALAADLPAGLGNLGYAQTIFTLTSGIPYDFGVLTQTLNETDTRFNTGAMRNVYSPDVRTANELVVDQLAKAMGKDPLAFRLAFCRNERVRGVLKKAREVAQWGKPMPAGTAQGVAVHVEYKGASACVVEIDCRPETVGRKVRDAVTGPRVMKATMVTDVGQVINPRGVEAQMQGAINDGIAMTLTSSLHLVDGHFEEASWDNYFYTRQWNTPPEIEVVIMDSAEPPGGVGEAGVAPTAAAVACAYARAVGKVPTEFPINHRDPLAFEPKPRTPPIPPSPTDGLRWTY
ncbi:molybdopterin cofactor-binding domain-containing protein [Nocardioides panzhihuensis]|uniref:Isoquinoline 1-oxidoreductase beta subunit n=1 Tax=Nocardioides panzhihuensis TaxID=860243 RepID=A0A7Z0DKA5_9ACTN|nr:molybdopterin cofactor-binding domain-containing protein [Nocardioides panzhihuensis]NYI76967.1 isoquinoline 1-oxidoreductase beta subunit [Nocardioides panzhihuensis]